MKLDLYYYVQCPFCQRVLSAIDDIGIQVNYFNTLENPEYASRHLQRTGRRTVPCLYIDDEPLFESSDIISWLHENRDRLPKKS